MTKKIDLAHIGVTASSLLSSSLSATKGGCLGPKLNAKDTDHAFHIPTIEELRRQGFEVIPWARRYVKLSTRLNFTTECRSLSGIVDPDDKMFRCFVP